MLATLIILTFRENRLSQYSSIDRDWPCDGTLQSNGNQFAFYNKSVDLRPCTFSCSPAFTHAHRSPFDHTFNPTAANGYGVWKLIAIVLAIPCSAYLLLLLLTFLSIFPSFSSIFLLFFYFLCYCDIQRIISSLYLTFSSNFSVSQFVFFLHPSQTNEIL